MTDDLRADYPEAAEYIEQAVTAHGEEWVLENYYQQISQLGVVMDVPEKEELPFFDADEHDTMSDEEVRKMGEALSQYRQNLIAASREATERDD
ncbi:hypothetical protein SAMN04487947_0697 [Halogeometricum rufum]|uniref:DUF8110 domain-containing protein n=1 Tax=Halogeometricum rufum TaxID=553469 RepID=A0A1I6G7R2_9EURY|nr:hypothetical protein [Halogeometricum rufum]MUV58198.1 hypothetical protein [Halogeometricum sp. CBA1124]SFR38224.1 hypothetical protein SAMN04487947_0697 [Halogeometricum rufum]